MKNTKVSKVMLSTLVTVGIVFSSLFVVSADDKVEAPSVTKGETQIELPSSALVIPRYTTKQEQLEEIKAEGIRLHEEQEERIRMELEKARQAEDARLAKIEAERKAKEEAERKAREELERQRQAKIARQQAQAQQQARQSQQTQSKGVGTAFNGSYYTAGCNGCSGVTATGYNVRSSIYVDGMRVIAVDPRVIPLFSIVQVTTPHETFKAIALDKGGAIKGHKVDILVADKSTAYSLGRHTVHIKVIRKGK